MGTPLQTSRKGEREKVQQQYFWSRMKLIALLCLAGILLELSIDKVDGSCLQNTPCTKCGRGARCVFEDVETDAENCDTTTDELASIASLARHAAKLAAFGFGTREYQQRMYAFARSLFEKFDAFDDSNIECEVEESSPLATYGHGNHYVS